MAYKVGDLVKLMTAGTGGIYGAVDKVRLLRGEQHADVLWKIDHRFRLQKRVSHKKLRRLTFLEKQTLFA